MRQGSKKRQKQRAKKMKCGDFLATPGSRLCHYASNRDGAWVCLKTQGPQHCVVLGTKPRGKHAG